MATTRKRTGAEGEQPERTRKAGAAGAGAGGSRKAATKSAAKGVVKRAAAAKRAGSPRIRSSHATRPGGDEPAEAPQKAARPRARKAAAPAAPAARTQAPAARAPLAAPKRAAKRASTPPAPQASDAARELALAIAAAGLDKKAIGVEILEVTGRVDYTDFLVVMTGRSDRHVHAIATGIEDALRQKKLAPLSMEGLGAATWVLIDFGDVVVHVFQEETRRLYDIEGLWMDAGRVPVPGGDAEGPAPTVTRMG